MDNKPNTFWDYLLSDPIIDRDYGEVKLLPEYKGKEPKIPDIRITRKTRDVYSKILFIMDSHKNIRNSEVPSVISISSTGFLNIYFKQQRVTDYINRMESLGIISKYQNAHYIKEKVINKETGKEEEVITWVTSNSYIWYPDNEAKIRNILQKEGIKPMQTDKKLDLRKKGVRSINDNLIKFGDTRIERPVDMEPIELIAYINSKLKSVYPLLPVMQDKVNKLNSQFYTDKPERRITYNPSIHFSSKQKSVSKIGIRYFCDFCSYSKEKKDYVPYRNDYLFSEGLDLHYDVKGSVPKISSLINFGTWSDNNEDPYKLMSDTYNKISGELDNPWNTKQRCAIKDIFVRVYFENTVKSAFTHIKRKIKDNGFNVDENETLTYVTDINKAITSCFGKSLGSEIFFHESNVYILALEQLLNDGFDVVTCFDSFYAHKKGVNQKDFDSYMDKLLEDCAFKYLEMLHQHKGTF